MAFVETQKSKQIPNEIGNGYNPQIFIEREKFLSNYQCVICKWIVKDCVEISCIDHDIHKKDVKSLDYNPIWCLKCLTKYLGENKDICPISGQNHSQRVPIQAVSNRYIRRQISRAKVKCINGHGDAEAAAVAADDNKNDYETYGLKLEGTQGTIHDPNNVKEVTGCAWQGLLCDYAKHIRDACEFMEIECPLSKHFNCCNDKMLKNNFKSMIKNDVNYLSKHFQVCFDNYLELKNKYDAMERDKQQSEMTIKALNNKVQQLEEKLISINDKQVTHPSSTADNNESSIDNTNKNTSIINTNVLNTNVQHANATQTKI